MTIRWFSVRLIFRATIDGKPSVDDLFEESYRVVRADSEASARARSEALGRDSAHAYRNEEGENVDWEFVRVAEVQDMARDELGDEDEVFRSAGLSPSS
jgi:hypothetical protein